VLGDDVVAAADHRQRTPGSGERDRGTRAGAVLDERGEAAEVLARVAGGVDEFDEVPGDRGVDVDRARIALHVTTSSRVQVGFGIESRSKTPESRRERISTSSMGSGWVSRSLIMKRSSWASGS